MRKLTFPLWRGFIVCLGHCRGRLPQRREYIIFPLQEPVCACVCVCGMEMDGQNECEQVEAFS